MTPDEQIEVLEKCRTCDTKYCTSCPLSDISEQIEDKCLCLIR
jgi:hypothetical protein